jgi:hypothetical protein
MAELKFFGFKCSEWHGVPALRHHTVSLCIYDYFSLRIAYLESLGKTVFSNVQLNWSLSLGIPCVIARSGWSPERGYEIYMDGPLDAVAADLMWEEMVTMGAKHKLMFSSPNHSRYA